MKILRAAVIAALVLFKAVAPVLANDVTLTSRDGSIEVTGYLLGFDGEFYRVDTEFGILTVDGSGVNCEGPACPTLGKYVAEFTLSGARSMGEVLIPAMIEGFALNAGYALAREEIASVGYLYTLFDQSGGTPAARITIRLNTSDEGFADLLGEEADMVLSLREVTRAERKMAREAGLGDLAGHRQSRVLAWDGLVPIVSPGNPVSELTMAELAGIFAGEITRWDALGGEDAPITPYLRDATSDAGRIFVARVLDAQGKALGDNVLFQSSYRAIAHAVAEDPFGIGITSFTQPGFGEVVTLGGGCGFEVVATRPTIKAGDYPLAAPLFLYLPARRLPKLARDFLAYLRTDPAQTVTQRAGFVDQRMSELSPDIQGRRLGNAILAAGDETPLEELQRMMSLFSENHRLTLTFRFRDGSATLDAASRSNVDLLAAALEAGRYDGRKLTLVGFTDGNGAATSNLALARRRAEAVRRAILEEAETLDTDLVTLATDAFGEALPMACDDTAWGRRVNRRVEIWMD